MAYLPEKKRMTLQGLFDAICETFSEEEAHAVARTLGIGTAHLRPALAELSAAAKAARRPMPPEHLVDAQQDRVHRDRRRARPARTVRNSRRGTP